MERFVEGKSENIDIELTLKSVLVYVWRNYVFLWWRLEKSGNFQRALQPEIFELLDKIARLRSMSPVVNKDYGDQSMLNDLIGV